MMTEAIECNSPLPHILRQGGIFIKVEYRIYAEGQDTGSACVTECGLYYHFSCRCVWNNASACRIAVTCGDKQTDLGLCIPMGETFGIETRIPIKKVGIGYMRFDVVTSAGTGQGCFVAIAPTKPFLYISKLRFARVEVQGGETGILFPQSREISMPIGQ